MLHLVLEGEVRSLAVLDELHKVEPLAIQEHVDVPAWSACHDLVPHEGEAELVPEGEAGHLVEPEAGEEVREGGMGAEDDAGVGDICSGKKK